MDSKAQFIKFRESWSHGYGEWQYTLIPSWCCFDKPDSIDTFLNETETPSDWSEHWRGWEWIKIEYPPMDFIDEKIDDIKDSTETISGRMVSIAFSKVVYSIEEIDNVPIYQFFPEMLPTQFKSNTEYMIACKKALRAYLIGMPPSVIDEVYEKYTELEAERDKALADLKN